MRYTGARKRRPENFDPQTDSLVRKEMSRLRGKIRDYYGKEGRDDAVRIRNKDAYHLTFEFADFAAAGASYRQT